MFRKMRRFKQEISRDECIELLINEKRGVLSLLGDDGYPYGLPINHYYDEKDNLIYFHGAKEGHKIDSLKNCNKVSYCVFEKGTKRIDHWSYDVRSVIIFGTIEFVSDIEKVKDICRKLSYKFTNDTEAIEKEINSAINRTQLLCLKIEHMSGKLVNEQ